MRSRSPCWRWPLRSYSVATELKRAPVAQLTTFKGTLAQDERRSFGPFTVDARGALTALVAVNYRQEQTP